MKGFQIFWNSNSLVFFVIFSLFQKRKNVSNKQVRSTWVFLWICFCYFFFFLRKTKTNSKKDKKQRKLFLFSTFRIENKLFWNLFFAFLVLLQTCFFANKISNIKFTLSRNHKPIIPFNPLALLLLHTVKGRGFGGILWRGTVTRCGKKHKESLFFYLGQSLLCKYSSKLG